MTPQEFVLKLSRINEKQGIGREGSRLYACMYSASLFETELHSCT